MPSGTTGRSTAAGHVEDAVERYNGSERVNVGSAFEISIRDLLETIVRLTEFDAKIVMDSSKPNG